jgi:hypothetical protein
MLEEKNPLERGSAVHGGKFPSQVGPPSISLFVPTDQVSHITPSLLSERLLTNVQVNNITMQHDTHGHTYIHHIGITILLLFYTSSTLLGRPAGPDLPVWHMSLALPSPCTRFLPKGHLFTHRRHEHARCFCRAHKGCSGISWFSGIRKGRKERREQNLFLILEDL